MLAFRLFTLSQAIREFLKTGHCFLLVEQSNYYDRVAGWSKPNEADSFFEI